MNFSATFKFIALCTVILSVFQSCEKRNATGANCLAFIKPDTLRFNVVDKNTGENLFFSSTPSYTADQIYFIIDNMAAHLKPKAEASTKLGKHFMIAVGAWEKSGIIKGFIDDKLEYTINYSMKKDKSSECPAYVFDKITINGNQQEENIKDRVILLKK
ncbi:MAG: hypothetical protein QM594_22330 [Niabella sp.]